MNSMFVNVQERTREIGLRKALGARRREILLQFLLEGLVTTVAGGAIGLTVSYFLVWWLSPRPFLAELLDDSSRVTDIQLVRQSCTFASVAFDDESVADFFDNQVDQGLQPSRFGRLWLHTHPANSAAKHDG